MPRAAYVDSAGVCQRVLTVSDMVYAPGALDAGSAAVGDYWDGLQWNKPVARREVPTEVTMREARRAIEAAGLTASVAAAIAALPEPTKTAAAIDWEFSNAVRRDNPTFIALASALGLSSDQLDDLFIAAAGVP